jgi:rsbT co-antagonist protein RsbR
MVVSTGACVTLLDITGVPVLDDQAASGLMQIGEALRLLGATAVLVGIRPEVAQSLVSLGVDSQHLVTTVDLQRGIDLALRMLRRQIVPLDAATAKNRRAT